MGVRESIEVSAMRLERPRNVTAREHWPEHLVEPQHVGLHPRVVAQAREVPTESREYTAQVRGDTFRQVCVEACCVHPHGICDPSKTGRAERQSPAAAGVTNDLIHPTETAEHPIYAADLARTGRGEAPRGEASRHRR
jgi:hypothetical protein